MEQTRHVLTVRRADGTSRRFGPEEMADVITSIDVETEIPGGYSGGIFSVPRPDRFDPLELPLFAEVELDSYETGERLYEGRINGTPSGTNAIEIQCVGHQKQLEDDATARAIFYDRDQSSWGAMSIARRLQLIGIGYTAGADDASQAWDYTAGTPAIDTRFTLDEDFPHVSEAWYDAKGLGLGGLDFAWERGQNPPDPAWPDYHWVAGLASDDVATDYLDSGELRAAGPGAGTVASGGDWKFAFLHFVYATLGSTFVGSEESILWPLAAVFGDHGLPLRGSVAYPNQSRGLYVSDMLAYIVGRWAPGLRFTTGGQGSIEPSSFAVPHSVFSDPGTARAMVEALTPFGGSNYPLDFGVYDRKTFFARSAGSYGRVWRVRRDQTASPSDDGPDADAQLNGVLVKYDDGSGTAHTVGPPGSGAELETDALLDSDPANPANYDGRPHTVVYDAGIFSAQGAILIGQLVLANARLQPWRGSVALKGTARDASGVELPVGLLRGGDFIVVEDDVDTRPRYVRSTGYDGVTVNGAVGQKPDRLATALARAGVTLTGRL